MLAALPGAIFGVPVGLLLFKAAVKSSSLPPSLWPWLGATVIGTLLAMAAFTIVPARLVARHPVVEVLQSEAT